MKIAALFVIVLALVAYYAIDVVLGKSQRVEDEGKKSIEDLRNRV